MTVKPTIEYGVRIRVPSGDTASISVLKGRVTIGTICMDESEFPLFVEALGRALEAAKKVPSET